MRTRLTEFARVTTPSGMTLTNTKVFVLDDLLLIFQRDGQKVKLIESVEVTADLPPRQGRQQVIVTSDGVYTVTPAGCGCGSPLKRFGAADAIALYLEGAGQPA